VDFREWWSRCTVNAEISTVGAHSEGDSFEGDSHEGGFTPMDDHFFLNYLNITRSTGPGCSFAKIEKLALQ
jgi:hypothetical protein